ncbi:MAG: methylated-DNA-[protein]-cysteine S-methyltransferase [Pseudohongiellaceae bacterium]|jgi:methylated-DNA-[protein]-cysteine S-methyltransferase
MTTLYTYHETPIGSLLLAGTDAGLSLLGFPQGKMQRRHEFGWLENSNHFTEVKRQLDDYFSGTLDSFSVALSPEGTSFQLAVWQALQQIPFGQTWSYGQLANYINRPKASRAVGAANGANPIPIIIPCHRVIGSTGKLTGFGGGIETKEFLLNLEAQRAAPDFGF